MQTKKEAERNLEKQLDSLSEKIDKLEAKIKLEQQRASEIDKNALLNLITMRNEAQSKLRSFKESGEDKWEELHIGLDQYWKSLGTELKAYDGRL